MEASCAVDGYESIHCKRCGTQKPDSIRTIEAFGHTWDSEYAIDVAAECTEDGSESIHCTVCGEQKPDSTRTIEALGHVWDEGVVTLFPTYDAPGVLTFTCQCCSSTKAEELPALERTPLNDAVIEPLPDITYTGVEIEPVPTVFLDGRELVAGADYTVSYENNVNAGTASITITGCEGYTGTASASFKIAKRSISVTVADASKVYGDSDPVFTGSIEGMIGEDVLDITYARVEADASKEDAGSSIAITAFVGDSKNYDVTVFPGKLTLIKATLTATYAGEEIAWNATPELPVTVTGFAQGDNVASAAGYVAPAVTAPKTLEPGMTYDLAPAGGDAKNYAFEYVGGKLKVNPKPAEVVNMEATDAVAALIAASPNEPTASDKAAVDAAKKAYLIHVGRWCKAPHHYAYCATHQ